MGEIHRGFAVLIPRVIFEKKNTKGISERIVFFYSEKFSDIFILYER